MISASGEHVEYVGTSSDALQIVKSKAKYTCNNILIADAICNWKAENHCGLELIENMELILYVYKCRGKI